MPTHTPFIKHPEAPASPKQKVLFRKLTGRDVHPDIRCKGGINVAIAAITSQTSVRSPNMIQLPWGCFCTKFSPAAVPIRSSLVDPKYSEGTTIGLLYRSLRSFSQVKRQTIAKAKKVEGDNSIKRNAGVFKPPELEKDEGIRRNYLWETK